MLKTADGKRIRPRGRLKEYYVGYYNEHMLRNYRLLFDKTQSFEKDGELIKYDATSLKASKYDKDNSLTFAPQWLVNRTRENGTLAGEITYFKSLQDFKGGAISKRYCDRLFFDLDVDDNPEVKELKAEFKKCNNELKGREHRKKLAELQRAFRDLILDKDLLRDVYDEATRLTAYLQRFGLKPYLVFSGSKGAHINVFFNEMQITNLSEIAKTLANSYAKELRLKYLDFNVFDRTRAHKRLQRVQYATHSKTGLITRPLEPDTTYDELLQIITSKSRRAREFDFNDYVAPAGFNKMLMKLDNEINFKKAEHQKKIEHENRAKRMKLQKKFGAKYKSFNEIDLKDIARAYGVDGKQDGDKIIVNCPFHADTHPSAVVYSRRFYCSTCNIALNYYEFISRLEGTNDKDKIIDIARRFL